MHCRMARTLIASRISQTVTDVRRKDLEWTGTISDPSAQLRILVVLASYGTSNDRYLLRLIEEYRSMSFDVDIVILSNLKKQPAPDIEVLVGLPSRDPWSLPFRHKKVFADRIEHYDLFVYSEDDILITERNLRAFLEVYCRFARRRNCGIFSHRKMARMAT